MFADIFSVYILSVASCSCVGGKEEPGNTCFSSYMNPDSH